MHATFVTLLLQVMQPLANVHETKWTPHVNRESDAAVHIIAVLQFTKKFKLGAVVQATPGYQAHDGRRVR